MKQFIRNVIVRLLEAEAKAVVRRYRPHIVGITGNIGKTSTKEAIAAVLGVRETVRKSPKSYNSEFGVPLTILGMESAWWHPLGWLRVLAEGLLVALFPHPYPQWLVLEIGADRPGDIERILTWLQLDIGVVTYVGTVPVHVEFFSSPEAVAEEKMRVAAAPGPEGIVLLNHDNSIVLDMKQKARGHVYTFGFDERATLRASNDHILYRNGIPEGETCKVDYQGKSVPVRILGTLGRQAIFTVLPAILVGISARMHLVEIIEALAMYVPPPGRSRLIHGIQGSTIIDDTYNSSPHALDAALETLHAVETRGRKIAVLGDMMELGRHTTDAHVAGGTHAAHVADIVVAVGQRARFFAESATEAGMDKQNIFVFDDAWSATKPLRELIGVGDVVLVKGSQYMRMERIVEALMAHPEKKEELLVRQDPEWLKRA